MRNEARPGKEYGLPSRVFFWSQCERSHDQAMSKSECRELVNQSRDTVYLVSFRLHEVFSIPFDLSFLG